VLRLSLSQPLNPMLFGAVPMPDRPDLGGNQLHARLVLGAGPMPTGSTGLVFPDRTVVGATAVAIARQYQVEFIDSTGAVLNVVTLTEAALWERAGASCVLAEVDRSRSTTGQEEGAGLRLVPRQRRG
jgi:hypothetical protein